MKAIRFLVLLVSFFTFAQYAKAGALVQFQFYFGASTYGGEVDVELYNQDKPATTANFIHLIQSGAYNGSFFHRCQPGFVLQGGGYAVYNFFNTNLIGPPYTNLTTVPNFGNVTNEINVGKFYSNTNWTVAMAKGSDPNSANSQFFFNTANNAGTLDTTNNAGGFTVFGHVVRGTNILGEFNGVSYGNQLFDLTQDYGTSGITPLFTQLPAYALGTNPPPYYDLIFFTVNALTAKIAVQTNGTRQISWTTVSGVTNNVEYATNFPPMWQVLSSMLYSNTATATVLDSSTNKTGRFYRIHVLF